MPNEVTGRAGGQPTKLTQATTDRIIQLVRAGNYLSTAAGASGVSEMTLHAWMKRGREGREGPTTESADDSPVMSYVEFYEKVRRARHEAEARQMAIITLAAERDWRAAAWFLERTQPRRYAPSATVKNIQTGDRDNPVVVVAGATEARAAIDAKLAAIRSRHLEFDRSVSQPERPRLMAPD